MEKVSCVDRNTKEGVSFWMVGDNKNLAKIVVMRNTNWIGHVVKREGLLMQVLEEECDV